MDYYNKLGVNKSASQDEIKRAYKKLAMKHHPDRGGDQKTFQEINEAYDTLKDNEKRYMYDKPQTRQQFNFNTGNMNDMFSQFFRQTQRVRKNSNMSITVRISLKDVVSGKDVVGKYMLGSGKQEVANIRIPPGVEDGLTMRYAGLGDNSVKQLPRGDLHVRIIVEKHKHFVRDRSHIRTKCSINVLELILGTEIIVTDLLGNNINVKIPKGTNPGTIMSIAGHGLPDMNTGKIGNLYLEIKGITPKIDDWNMLEEVKKLNDGTSIST